MENTSAENGASLSRTRGLRPPWKPGQSGNPSGLRKDGTSPKGRKLEASLLERLERPGTMDRIAARWVNHALKGSFPHLNAILDRLYPVEKKDTSNVRVVVQGVRLELDNDGRAKGVEVATAVHELNEASLASERSEGARLLIEGDALERVSESQRESSSCEPPHQLSESLVLEGHEDLTPDESEES